MNDAVDDASSTPSTDRRTPSTDRRTLSTRLPPSRATDRDDRDDRPRRPNDRV
jgi:hypothetical protein